MKKIFHILPPVVLALILSLIFLQPQNVVLLPSAVSPDLPLENELEGWYGVKTQESKRERAMLAPDTKFSKGLYNHINPFTYSKEDPTISVSIVYSGSDMGESIHRPERCLPSQGHINLLASETDIRLSNGRQQTFTRLASQTPVEGEHNTKLNHIHYYVFISSDTICPSHLERTLHDICDRALFGRVQRWAYIQLGAYWGAQTGITEEQADNRLRDLISKLVSRQVDWNAIKN